MMNPEKTTSRAPSPSGRNNGLRAVIFDVDGTLADTEAEGHRVAFNRAFQEFGVDWYWSREAYGDLLSITGGKERIRHYLSLPEVSPPALLERHGIETWIARLHAIKSDIYSSMVLSDKIPLRPGVARLIRELRSANVRLAIATTTTPSSLASLIRVNFGSDMLDLFEVVGAGDVVPNKKPEPDIYNWVLKKLDLPAEDCLVIEDSAPGLQAARAAGLTTVITVSAYTADHDFSGAIAVISDLGEPGVPMHQHAGIRAQQDWVSVSQLQNWHAKSLKESARPIHHAA